MPLPVRLEAALTITKFLGNDSAENMLKPLLGNLIENYLNLMNEVDSESLADALQSLMLVFSDDIMPFAIDIITKLAATYQNHVEAMTSSDKDI
jgi:importin-7